MALMLSWFDTSTIKKCITNVRKKKLNQETRLKFTKFSGFILMLSPLTIGIACIPNYDGRTYHVYLSYPLNGLGLQQDCERLAPGGGGRGFLEDDGDKSGGLWMRGESGGGGRQTFVYQPYNRNNNSNSNSIIS